MGADGRGCWAPADAARRADADDATLDDFLRRAAIGGGDRRFFFDFDDPERAADNARINWSFRIACQPAIPLALAN
jgi:hypothetical protein